MKNLLKRVALLMLTAALVTPVLTVAAGCEADADDDGLEMEIGE